MSRYSNTPRDIWNDGDFPFLSDDCQLVVFHLRTTPKSTQFGIFKETLAGLAAEKRWTVERYEKAFREAFDKGFVRYDERHQLIWVLRFLDEDGNNKPNSPNVLFAWGKEFKALPDCSLKDEFFQFFSCYMKAMGEGFQKAFEKAFLISDKAFFKKGPPVSGTGPGNGSGKEGGAGGDLKIVGASPSGCPGVVSSECGAGSERQGPLPESPGERKKTRGEISRERSGIAFREFRAEVEKCLRGEKSVPEFDDVITRNVYRTMNGMDGIKATIGSGTDEVAILEPLFRERYERRELARFEGKGKAPPVKVG